MASLYPSYEASETFGQVILGTLYGLVDGVICGALCLVVQHICGGQAVPGDVIPHLDVTGRYWTFLAAATIAIGLCLGSLLRRTHRESATKRTYRVCRECDALEPADVGRLIDTIRRSPAALLFS